MEHPIIDPPPFFLQHLTVYPGWFQTLDSVSALSSTTRIEGVHHRTYLAPYISYSTQTTKKPIAFHKHQAELILNFFFIDI